MKLSIITPIYGISAFAAYSFIWILPRRSSWRPTPQSFHNTPDNNSRNDQFSQHDIKRKYLFRIFSIDVSRKFMVAVFYDTPQAIIDIAEIIHDIWIIFELMY